MRENRTPPPTSQKQRYCHRSSPPGFWIPAGAGMTVLGGGMTVGAAADALTVRPPNS